MTKAPPRSGGHHSKQKIHHITERSQENRAPLRFCFPVSRCPSPRRSPCQSVVPHRNVSSYHGVPLSSFPPWTEPPRSGSSVTTCGIPARRARSRQSPRAASGTARPFAKAEKDGRILRSPLAKGKAVRYNMGIVCIFALCAPSRAHGPARPALPGTCGRATGVRGLNPLCSTTTAPRHTQAFGR